MQLIDNLSPDSLAVMFCKDSVDRLGGLLGFYIPQGELRASTGNQVASVWVECNGAYWEMSHRVHNL